MGGAAGEGGSEVAPVIESLTTDAGVVTSWDTVVTFSAVVTDPQDDVVGGELSSGMSYGAFEPAGADGRYELVLTIDGSGSWPEHAYKVFLAVFRDRAGHTAERTVVVHIDIGGCSEKPDHETCRACFCALDPVGCDAYTEREYQYLYCGSACSQDCGAFCETFYANAPDPQLIAGFCKACQPSQADVDAFNDSCLANIPDCFGFFVDVGQCPA
jgi:hypothetical protein